MMVKAWSVLAGIFGRVLRIGGRARAFTGAVTVMRSATPFKAPSLRRTIPGQVPRTRLVGNSFTVTVERMHGRSEHLTRPHQIKPPLGSVGQLLRPALLSPRRQGRDNKGRALGFG